jgi:hypothetical protein
MMVSDKGMAPQVMEHPGTRPTRRSLMDTTESSALAHPSTEDHVHQDERPCACNDGWVTIGQIAVDPETGEDVEEFALYLCCRCADSR